MRLFTHFKDRLSTIESYKVIEQLMRDDNSSESEINSILYSIR